MRVKATRAFHDNEAGCRRERGVEFDAPDERGAHLVSLGLAKRLEEAPKAPTKKKATRRRCVEEPEPKE